VHARIIHPTEGRARNSQQDQAQHERLYSVPFHIQVLACCQAQLARSQTFFRNGKGRDSSAMIVFDPQWEKNREP
jgi:hypothetical protein